MLILNKILAIYVGPFGYVAIGQLQNIMQLFGAFSTTSLHSGVVKYTAEYSSEKKPKNIVDIWRAVSFFSILTSLVLILLVIFFGDHLTKIMFGHSEFGQPLLVYAIIFVLICFNNHLLAILNGKREVVRLAIANSVGSVFAVIVTYFLTTGWGLSGALIALASYQGLWFFGTVLLCFKKKWFKFNSFFGKFSSAPVRKLSGFFAMAIATAVAVPFMQIMIRSEIIDNHSAISAGYWEAMIRLSAVYGLFFSSVLSVYFLPKFASIKSFRELKFEVFDGYRLVVPITFAFFLCVFLMREDVVRVAFSEDFLPISEMFFWVLIGDFFKVCSWLLSYILVAKALTKVFIVSELLFTGVFIILSTYALRLYSFEAVFQAYAFGYFLYFTYLGIIVFSWNGISRTFKN